MVTLSAFRRRVTAGGRHVDVDLPPGVAFVRSLGRAGAPVRVCTADRGAPGRFSRHATWVDDCPPELSTSTNASTK